MTAPEPQASPDDRSSQRSRGIRFLLLGLGLMACGIAAVMLPDAATIATGHLLGAIVMTGGIIVIIQTLRDKTWHGFTWQLLFGSAEVVGGALIILNPLKGAAAVTLLVAIILVMQAATQIGLALRIRPVQGWWWLLGTGLITLAIAAGLLLRFPYSRVDSPGEMAGLAMSLAGAAFVLMALGWLKAQSRTPA
jgi:uncharacterized membrane protein HdeD (DUF308 family)